MSRGENKENTRSRKDHFKTPIRVCGFFHCWKHPSLGLAFKTEIRSFFSMCVPKQAQDWNPEAWPGWLHPHFLSTATSKTYSLLQMLVAQSCSTLRNPMVARLLWPQNSPGKNTEMGCHFHQGIFPTQESNLDLPHCGQILHHLNQKESPISLPRPFFNYQPYQPFSCSGTGRVVCCWSQAGWWSLELRTMLSVIPSSVYQLLIQAPGLKGCCPRTAGAL